MTKKRGIAKWILLSILCIWIAATVFFYFQHRVQVDRYYIGEYIEFDDFGVFVKDIERYDFEKNVTDTYGELNSVEEFLYTHLPRKMGIAFFKIKSFYSMPYQKNEDYKYDVNCEIITDQEFLDSNKNSSNITSIIEIDLYSEDFSKKSIATIASASGSSDRNVYGFKRTGIWNEECSSGIKILNSETEEEYTFSISEPFETTTYDFFNKRPGFNEEMSCNVANPFVYEYSKGDAETARTYIKEGYFEDFNFSVLELHENFWGDQYKLEYLGDFMDEENVFNLKVSDYDSDGDLSFNLVYEDYKWKILDVE